MMGFKKIGLFLLMGSLIWIPLSSAVLISIFFLLYLDGLRSGMTR